MEQIEDAVNMGYSIVRVDDGRFAGAIDIHTAEDRDRVVDIIRQLVREEEATAVFGVFPTPILAAMSGNREGVDVFAAWNIQRTQDGGKPTFAHRSWEHVGLL
jgi:hypothetical protein